MINKETEIQKLIKERDYFRVDHESVKISTTLFEHKIEELKKEHENFKFEISGKEQELLSKEAIQRSYEQRFQELVAKVSNLEYQIDTLERTKSTLEEKNKVFEEENKKLKEAQDNFADSVKKMNDERNHFKDYVDAANLRIKSFTEQLHHSEDINKRLNKELDKVKTNLSKAERYSDALEIK